jgi:probable rRNA maturation factor
MSNDIFFFSEQVSYVIRNKIRLRKWISKTIEQEGQVSGDINFILCNDEIVTELNLKYLKHNTLTDVLTFQFEDERGLLSGDIYISIARVKENAKKYNQHLEDELHRVIIHSVLHLIGYKDSSARDKVEMRDKENFYLALLK